ncbi:lipopolysaccharide ABC transporter substrate-binding protein LptA [Enterobacteriaceae bacterium LUAb1]
MTFKMPKNSLSLMLTGVLFATSTPALALTGDAEKTVNITSQNQSLDINGNVATFTGNVIITQGSIKITANKAVVTRPGGDSSKTIFDAYGTPATFYQMQDNGKPIQGHAQKMRYELAKDRVELTDNAWLEQLDSSITGNRITYLVKEQKMEAYSGGKSNRVTTVLVPSQLQDKNSTRQKKSD